MLRTTVIFAAVAGASCFAPTTLPLTGRATSLRTNTRPSAVTMSMDSDASKFSRRAVMSGLFLAALGSQRAAVAATDEEVELMRLKREAARIQAVFDEQLSTIDMPNLREGKMAPVVDDMVVRNTPAPSPLMSGDETVAVLMQTMKDGGIENNDIALKSVLDFASARNPIKRIPAELFVEELKNHDSKYSVLTSDYYTARISAPEIKSKTKDEEIRSYLVSVEAPLPLLKSCSVPDQCIASASTTSVGAAKPREGSYFVTFKWELSKSKKNNCWLYDSCELMASSTAGLALPPSSVKTA